MDKLNVRRQLRKISDMSRNDAACFEGCGSGTPNREQARAFSKLQRLITREMLQQAANPSKQSIVGSSKSQAGVKEPN